MLVQVGGTSLTPVAKNSMSANSVSCCPSTMTNCDQKECRDGIHVSGFLYLIYCFKQYDGPQVINQPENSGLHFATQNLQWTKMNEIFPAICVVCSYVCVYACSSSQTETLPHLCIFLQEQTLWEGRQPQDFCGSLTPHSLLLYRVVPAVYMVARNICFNPAVMWAQLWHVWQHCLQLIFFVSRCMCLLYWWLKMNSHTSQP